MVATLLIVKTSALGDVVHTLPAINDIVTHRPTLRIHWVVESSYAEIARLCPSIDRVLPVGVHRWRRAPLSRQCRAEYRAFKATLRETRYDKIVDAQGLLKSAWISRQAYGERHGFTRDCVREPLASCFYHKKHDVPKNWHAVARLRALFAAVLGYTVPNTEPMAAIQAISTQTAYASVPTVIFFHGTSWHTKRWSCAHWSELANYCHERGLHIILPWGSAIERQSAEQIASQCPNATVLSKQSLKQLAGHIQVAKGVITTDTGLGHLSALMGKPTLSLFGPTDHKLTGTIGMYTGHCVASLPCRPCLQESCYISPNESTAPCMHALTPRIVFDRFVQLLQHTESL